jgi:methionine-rich copper-binding protein CopC
MVRRLALAFAASLALATYSSSALAHAMLKKASPPVGGAVSASPSEIRITFSERVEPRFSGIAVSTEAGASAYVGKSSVDPSDAATLVTPVSAPLKPGVYTVHWHAVSVDTHRTQGSFQFTVRP